MAPRRLNGLAIRHYDEFSAVQEDYGMGALVIMADSTLHTKLSTKMQAVADFHMIDLPSHRRSVAHP